MLQLSVNNQEFELCTPKMLYCKIYRNIAPNTKDLKNVLIRYQYLYN